MTRAGQDDDPYTSYSNNIFEDDMRDPSTPDKISPFFHDIEDAEPDVKPLELPAGTYSLLPAIDRCDNARLPQGPFGPFWHRRAREERKAIREERDRLNKLKEDNHDDDTATAALLATLDINSKDPQNEEELIPLFVHEGDKKPIGFLRPSIVDAMLKDNEKAVTILKMQPCWKVLSYTLEDPCSPSSHQQAVLADTERKLNDAGDSGAEPKRVIWGICINDWLNEQGKEGRSEHFDRLIRSWHQSGQFSEELKGWRGELYPVYGPEKAPGDEGFNPLPGANHVFDVERAACSLFGFATFGVHLTAYVQTEDGQYKIWVPKRSATKQTWPGYLDNSVAGGITTGDSPLETIIRECAEEANLPSLFVRKRARPVGVISYVYRNKYGFLQPEVQYIYDLEMPPPVELPADLSKPAPKPNGNPDLEDTKSDDVEPATAPAETSTKVSKDSIPDINEKGEPCVLRPCDGEAESFSLMRTDEVLDNVVKNKFKANCALVLLDFFMRHGLLTAETDAKYLEISQRLRGSIYPLPGPA